MSKKAKQKRIDALKTHPGYCGEQENHLFFENFLFPEHPELIYLGEGDAYLSLDDI